MQLFFKAFVQSLCCLILLFNLFSCSSKPDSFPADSAQIMVSKPGLRLFSTPGSKGKALRKLKLGEVLQDLGEVSPFLTPLSLNGQGYTEPWLKVRTHKGEVGWVYGAVLYNPQEQATQKVLPKRLAALLAPLWLKKLINTPAILRQLKLTWNWPRPTISSARYWIRWTYILPLPWQWIPLIPCPICLGCPRYCPG